MARGVPVSPAPTPSSSIVDSDPTGIDATVRVLTPATSIFEEVTSINPEIHHENLGEKTGTTRRVTRSSLENAKLEDMDYGMGKHMAAGGGVETITGEQLGRGGLKAKLRRSQSLRSSSTTTKIWDIGEQGKRELNSINVHETADSTLLRNGSIDVNASTEKHLVEESKSDATAKNKNARKERKNRMEVGKFIRRSTRLSTLGQTDRLTEKDHSVLGKRTVGALLKTKDKVKHLDRRASLRPRVESQNDATLSQAHPAKKRRVSEGDKSSSQPAAQGQPAIKENGLIRQQRKSWLKHGLYAGQEYVESSAPKTKKKEKNAKRAERQHGTVFPLPMYAGARLLENGRDYKLPFDIFSPLPHGQPKPDEWRKRNKNTFVGDAASIWKASKLKEHSTCTCTPETGCDENCQNRYMFYECDDTNCKLGPELCHNRPFSELRRRCKAGGKFNIGVEVIKTKDRGYGVRSNRSFNPNQIIVEYTGEILTQEECERRMRTIYKKNDCYYLMYFDQNMIIDATRGSIARFINHSCEPNCRMEKWTVAGKPRMALFAGDEGIMTGEELTYDYNFDPYSQKNVQECRCGAPTCRGVLGPKLKESMKTKDKEQKSTQTTAATIGSKRKIGNVLDDSSSRLNKKPRVPKSASVKIGIKETVSKARTTFKSAKAKADAKTAETEARKPRATRGIPSKKPSSTVIRAKMPTKLASRSAKGTERQLTQKNGKLNMPSKPRLANSIAAARTSNRTPVAMRAFLKAGSTKTKTENSLISRTKGKGTHPDDAPLKYEDIAGKQPTRRRRGQPRKTL
ncbi:protein lysine methyltransferase [Emydomyces testavorans]|uniref:Protein lysine methyltransferase n=1 Tax=Emydomyces testavorans TaxID=2070801 RepID=A0AAF0IIC7_9EURO|nr:protein lysine methyltransferase [Emydomyces testavorans]